ncbi:MAG: hypothetical protein ABW252_20950 [Polyangiales bacterium]
MFQRGWFHIDVARREALHDLLEVVRAYGPARTQALTEQGIAELSQPGRFAGLIVDVVPNGTARLLGLLARLPNLPVLVLLHTPDAALINQLQARGATVAVAPFAQANVVSFVQRALTHSFVPSERVASTIAHLAATRGLTAREVQLLDYCIGDEPRERVRRRLGITENTLKTQIRGLLRKCGERNLDALAKNVLRATLAPPSGEAEVAMGQTTRPMMSPWA